RSAHLQTSDGQLTHGCWGPAGSANRQHGGVGATRDRKRHLGRRATESVTGATREPRASPGATRDREPLGAPPGASRSDAWVGAGVWGQSPHHEDPHHERPLSWRAFGCSRGRLEGTDLLHTALVIALDLVVEREAAESRFDVALRQLEHR